MQPFMSLKKKRNLFPLMPTSLIRIQPNLVSSQLQVKMTETKQESFPVPLGMLHQTLPSQKRRHPTEYIQSRMVLTGSRNPKAFSSFGPPHSQARMECKTCLVLKHNCLPRAQRLKFFLRPSKISWPHPISPGDRHNRHALVCSPVDGSTSEPGGPSALSQIASSSEQPASAHPNEPGLTQTLKVTSPDDSLIPAGAQRSAGPVDPVSEALVKFLIPPHLPYASRCLNSDVSTLKHR